jgi:PAS domain S-box-containing protein
MVIYRESQGGKRQMSEATPTRNGRDVGPADESSPMLAALAAALQHVTIGMAVSTADGQLIDANPAYARMLGYERDELLARGFESITHPDEEAIDHEQWQRLAAGEMESYQREKRYLRKDGSALWGRVTVSALRDAQGAFAGGFAHVQDITSQKLAETALREQEAQLEALVSQLPVALYSLEPGSSAAFPYVSPRFTQLTKLGRDDLPTTFAALLNRVHPDDRETLSNADEHATRTGEPAQIEFRIRGGNGEWIWVDNRSVLMRDERGRPRVWHGALLDVSERKRLEASLQESQERFRRAFEDAAIGMSLGTPDDVCLDVNAAYCRIVGRPREAVVGHPFAEFTHPDDVGTYTRQHARLYSGEVDSYEIEKRYLRPDGTVVTGLLTVSAVRDDAGAHLYDIGQLQDITAQKAAEAALRESETQLRTVVEQMPAAVYRLEPGASGRYTYTSPHFTALTGVPLDFHDGDLEVYLTRVHPDDVETVRQGDAEAGRTGLPLDLEYRLRGQDDSWIWVHDRSTLTRDECGDPLAWHGVLLDVSEERRLEAALRESEKRFRLAFEGAGIGMSLTDPERPILLDVNPALCRLLGYTRDELLRKTFPEITHPDDIDFAGVMAAKLIAGELETYTIAKRYIRSDGRIVWTDFTANALRHPDGELIYIMGQVQDITARKEAEAALRESESRFRSIFEGAGIGMALSVPEGTILVANPALERLLGYASGELEGVRIDDITYPEDLQLQVNHLQRMRQSELDAYQFEKRFVRKDGGIVWGLLNATAVKDDRGVIQAVIGQVQDITAHKEAEAALRESEARFRALVQNDPDVIVVIDETMSVVYLSPSATAALGVSPDELLGLIEPNLHLIHPADLEPALALIEEVGDRPGATASVEARIEHRDLGWRWFQITVANQLQDPGIEGYLFNLRDITDRKHAELASEAALEAQEAAIAELERLNQSKSRFLSTISHEFRTPLTAIIGYSELLAGNASDPAVTEDAAVIHREASRLNRLVDDIVLVDRMDDEQMSVKMTSVDCNTLAQDVVETFRPLTNRHQFSLALDPSLLPVDGDRDRLSQALTNLVSNAVKYSPAGGMVTIVTRNDGDDVVVSVRDEGIGVARDDLARIFDRFERVETGIAGRIAGTGLGLSIAQEIAMLHGGRLWAESKPRRGSTFHLVIPAATSRESARRQDGKTARRQDG